jgi:D-alanyl-D-alanine carboxypeptidase/D-alanyl-D-alanine-endopeptidase (penicillin-binding protein 4)
MKWMFYLTNAVSRFSAFFILTFILSTLLFFTGCRSNNQTEIPAQNQPPLFPENAAESAFEVPAPNINLANPLVVSQRPEDAATCAEINEKIEKSPFSNARWGVFAVSLKDGRVVCSLDGRKLFNPASIQKTLTAVVALDKLGADYRWKTSIYGNDEISADGVLNGDLIIYGEGAPDFNTEALENLVGQLQAKGLKRVSGNVVGDSSYFRGDPIGDGWTWNELQWYYGAEASALSFNENQAFINVENGVGRATTDYLQVTVGNPTAINGSSGGEANKDANKNANYEAGGIKRGLDDNNFYVWGKVKNFGARVSVANPAGLVAKNLKESLLKKGIAVDGEPQSRDWKSADALDAAKARELAAVQSAPLVEIVKRMNKHSVNLYAELILRTIGKRFGDTVPNDIQLPQNVRGDDTSGAAVMKRWLLEHKIAADDAQIADGSGLSRLDFVSPETFARAFIAAAQSASAQAFADSLPISATDGTLGGRLGKAKGKVIAKTGTITFVNSLAGYAAADNGEVLAFAVITNNETRQKGVTNVIDAAVMTLVTGAKGENKDENENKNVIANEPKNANVTNSNQANSFYERNLANGTRGN